MKLFKEYLLDISNAFDDCEDKKIGIVVGPLVLCFIVSVFSALYGIYNDATVLLGLWRGVKAGFVTYCFINFLWWGMFLIGVGSFTIIKQISRWSKS